MAKPKNGALVGQASKLFKLCKLWVRRGIEKGLLHGEVGQAEPLLREVNTQHGCQRKRWPAGATFSIKRSKELDQSHPWNDVVSLFQKLASADFLDTEIKG